MEQGCPCFAFMYKPHLDEAKQVDIFEEQSEVFDFRLTNMCVWVCFLYYVLFSLFFEHLITQ